MYAGVAAGLVAAYGKETHIDGGESKLSLAMHWGTFCFVYDRLEEPPKDIARDRKEMGIPDTAFYDPKHGEIVPLFR